MRKLTLLFLLLLVAPMVLAGDPLPSKVGVCGAPFRLSKSGKPVELAVHVRGKKAGEALTLELGFGRVATRGVRVYSEPSHTLLALVVDSKFAKTTEGIAWTSTHKEATPPRAFVTSLLPAAKPSIFVEKGRPSGDDRLAVWINGDFPYLGIADRLIADGRIGNGDFAFGTSIEADPTTLDDALDPEHCCEAPGLCEQICKECTGAFFYCCLTSCQCEISCPAIKCLYPCP